MEVNVTFESEVVRVAIKGRVDSATASDLDKELSKLYKKTSHMVLDFEKVDFISSAGLRAIMAASKAMSAKQGSLKIVKVSPIIAEVFDMTGFSEYITVE